MENDLRVGMSRYRRSRRKHIWPKHVVWIVFLSSALLWHCISKKGLLRFDNFHQDTIPPPPLSLSLTISNFKPISTPTESNMPFRISLYIFLKRRAVTNIIELFFFSKYKQYIFIYWQKNLFIITMYFFSCKKIQKQNSFYFITFIIHR